MFPIKQPPQGCAGEPGGECHVLAPHPPEPSYLNFILYSPRLVCLRGYEPVCFLPPISRHLFPCPEAVMTCNLWWCWPCIISIRHHGLRVLYISGSNYRLGLSFPLKHHSRGSGVRQGSRGLSSPSSGRAPWHSSPRFALPQMLHWITSVEYHSFCFP